MNDGKKNEINDEIYFFTEGFYELHKFGRK